jgi:hypothetical protein
MVRILRRQSLYFTLMILAFPLLYGCGNTATAWQACGMDQSGCGDPSAGTCQMEDGNAVCQCSMGHTFDGATCVPSALQTALTNGNLSLPFSVAINGQNMVGGQFAAVSSVAISGNVGTLVESGVSYPAVVYQQVPFPAAGDTLYEMLAVAANRLIVAWAYCSGGMIQNLSYEATDQPTNVIEEMTGTCAAAMQGVTTAVELPALNLQLPPVVTGFSIQGSQLLFDGQHAGLMQVEDATWGFSPFASVDCSSGCGTPGWYELHSLIYNPDGSEVCFGIYYLELADTSHVHLDYVLCLPNLATSIPSTGVFPATYTHP